MSKPELAVFASGFTDFCHVYVVISLALVFWRNGEFGGIM